MKRITYLLLILFAVSFIAGCSQPEDVFCCGLNAEIVEIDEANQILYVADLGEKVRFGERCAIDCSGMTEAKKIIFVDYETTNLSTIRFSDLSVGDRLSINVYSSQLEKSADGPITVDQIQLAD